MALKHEENEAKIAYFRRETVSEGVQLARIALRKGESSMPHFHTITRDTFYVMAGRLTLTLRVATADPLRAYRALSASPAEVTQTTTGEFIHRLCALPGDVVVIEPGVLHCATNVDELPCSFLCIEGIGEYDFIEA